MPVGLEPARGRASSGRAASAASRRGRRQAAEAGAYLRSKYADVPPPLPFGFYEPVFPRDVGSFLLHAGRALSCGGIDPVYTVWGCGQKVGPRGGPDWRFACTAGRRSSSSSWRRRTAWGRPPPRSSRGSRWARPRSGRRGTSRTATPGRAVESGRGNRHGRRPAWAPTSRSTPRRRPARSPGSTRTR